MDIFSNYRKTSGYINRLIQDLNEHPQADADRVGLIGFSMGAHIIYYYLAKEHIIQNYEERVSSFHPLAFLPDYHALPLLILTGEEDDKIPAGDLLSFYQQIEGSYGDKEKIAIKVYPNVGHQLTEEMLYDSMMWMKKYLY